MGWWSTPRPGRFTPGKTRYLLYRGLGEPQGRSRLVRKKSPPPGFDPWTAQSVASPYTDWAIPAHIVVKVRKLFRGICPQGMYFVFFIFNKNYSSSCLCVLSHYFSKQNTTLMHLSHPSTSFPIPCWYQSVYCVTSRTVTVVLDRNYLSIHRRQEYASKF